jgi:hypothetical protein
MLVANEFVEAVFLQIKKKSMMMIRFWDVREETDEMEKTETRGTRLLREEDDDDDFLAPFCSSSLFLCYFSLTHYFKEKEPLISSSFLCVCL